MEQTKESQGMQGEQGACAVLGAVEDGCLLMRRYDTHDLFVAVS